MEKISRSILLERDDFLNLQQVISEFKNDLDSQLKMNFNKWCENSALAVSSGDLV